MVDPAPGPQEAEISLFGSGYGECVLIHLGMNEWAIVDCCVDDDDALPVIEYLRAMGVDPATAVKLVLASHWHDDHVRGISRVLELCERARFSCSGTFRGREAMATVRLPDRHGPERRSRPLRELSRAIDIVLSRLRDAGSEVVDVFEFADAWSRPVFDRTHPFGARVQPLSPSTQTRLTAATSIGGQLLEGTDTTQRVRPHANDLSVVLWVTVGNVAMLLGSDLEKRRQRGMGWTAILDHPAQRDLGPADIYKVAHHGSANADHPRVWAELLVERPPALVAPWQFPEGSANQLPRPGDIDRLCSEAGEVWVTAPPASRAVEVDLGIGGPGVVPDDVREITYECGRVTFRCDATKPVAWSRSHTSPAYRACP